jgi:hypothetical protein
MRSTRIPPKVEKDISQGRNVIKDIMGPIELRRFEIFFQDRKK